MDGDHSVNMNERPSSEQLLHYADSQAHRILKSVGFPPDKRTITVIFAPGAETNLEAVSEWIQWRLMTMNHLQIADLNPDGDLAVDLEVSFYKRLEAGVLAMSGFD